MTITIHGTGKIPSKKNQMIVVGRRLVKSKDVKRFETELKCLALQTMVQADLPVTADPVNLHLSVTFGDRRKRDIQNCFGAVCDALEGVVYDNDSQIKYISADKTYVKGVWGYTIKIQTIKG